jgi:hypothetical protein
LRWGDCQRLTVILAGSQPGRSLIGVGVRVAIGNSHRLIYRRAHGHLCRDRSGECAARSVRDVEEHPLGVRAGDTASPVASP